MFHKKVVSETKDSESKDFKQSEINLDFAALRNTNKRITDIKVQNIINNLLQTMEISIKETLYNARKGDITLQEIHTIFSSHLDNLTNIMHEIKQITQSFRPILLAKAIIDYIRNAIHEYEAIKYPSIKKYKFNQSDTTDNPFIRPSAVNNSLICDVLTGRLTDKEKLKKLKYLLRKGSTDPNARDERNYTVLYYVIFYFNFVRDFSGDYYKYPALFLKELLEYGADPFSTPVFIKDGNKYAPAWDLMPLLSPHLIEVTISTLTRPKKSLKVEIQDIKVSYNGKQIDTTIQLSKTSKENKKIFETKKIIKTEFKKSKALHNNEIIKIYSLHKDFFGTTFEDFIHEIKPNNVLVECIFDIKNGKKHFAGYNFFTIELMQPDKIVCHWMYTNLSLEFRGLNLTEFLAYRLPFSIPIAISRRQVFLDIDPQVTMYAATYHERSHRVFEEPEVLYFPKSQPKIESDIKKIVAITANGEVKCINNMIYYSEDLPVKIEDKMTPAQKRFYEDKLGYLPKEKNNRVAPIWLDVCDYNVETLEKFFKKILELNFMDHLKEFGSLFSTFFGFELDTQLAQITPKYPFNSNQPFCLFPSRKRFWDEEEKQTPENLHFLRSKL